MKLHYLKNGETCVFFWHEYAENGFLSNWYDSPFIFNNVQYTHMEQYIMAEKAKLFHDNKIYAQILRSKTPKEAKSLGRKVSGYIDEVWAAQRYNILMIGLSEKFSQNLVLCNELLATGYSIIAEASPYDAIWGIGLDANSAIRTPKHEWPGQNLLGTALMELRSALMESNTTKVLLNENTRRSDHVR